MVNLAGEEALPRVSSVTLEKVAEVTAQSEASKASGNITSLRKLISVHLCAIFTVRIYGGESGVG